MWNAIKGAFARGFSKLKEVSSNAVAQVGTGIAVLSSTLVPGKALAQTTDYAATAATQITTLSTAFDTIYEAAFGVMIAIVVAMVVWKYGKKLGMKV